VIIWETAPENRPIKNAKRGHKMNGSWSQEGNSENGCDESKGEPHFKGKKTIGGKGPLGKNREGKFKKTEVGKRLGGKDHRGEEA